MTDNHVIFVIYGEVPAGGVDSAALSKSRIYLIRAFYFCVEHKESDTAGHTHCIFSPILVSSLFTRWQLI